MSEETKQEQPTLQAQEQPQAQPLAAVAKKEEYSPEKTRTAISKLPAQLAPLKNLMAMPWESFKAAFADPAEADRIMQREITYTAQILLGNEYLVKCAMQFPDDFINALKNVALSGLSLSPTLKQGYLVPFKGHVTFMPSYMGMNDLLANNGHVKKIESYPVFEGDEFSMTHGTKEELVHKPNPWGERTYEKMLGCYWIAELTDGTKLFNNMTKAEIEEIKRRSPSVQKGKQSPWDSDPIEMARKTCLRRGFKALPKGAISDDRIKVIESCFSYDEAVEQNWIAEQKRIPKTSSFDEGEETEYEEIQ